MSHGSVILAMEDPLPPSLVGHPVEVRFLDTNSLGGEALAAVFGTLNDLLHKVVDPITLAFAEGVGGGSESLDSVAAEPERCIFFVSSELGSGKAWWRGREGA